MDKLESETEIGAKPHHKISWVDPLLKLYYPWLLNIRRCFSMCHSSEAQTHEATGKVMGWVSRAKGNLAFDGRPESEL